MPNVPVRNMQCKLLIIINPCLFSTEGYSIQRKTKALQCLNTFSQFKHFMHRVHEVLKELAEDYQDALGDSRETDDKPNSRETDASINKDIDDNDNNSTDDSRDTDTTTAAPDSDEDSRENKTVVDNTNSQEIYSMSTDGTVRVKRDTEVEGFDLGEVLDKLEVILQLSDSPLAGSLA